MRNYVVCSGSTPVTCPTYWSAQSNCEAWYTDLNGIYNRKLYQIRTNPTGTPTGAPSDYTYKYRREYTIMIDGVQVYAGIDYGYIDVPANTVDYQFYLICSQRLYGGGGSETDELWTFSYYEEYQETIPTCYTPPSCAMDIVASGTSATAPTLRGDDNGSITVEISGNTNPTDWYLQGEVIFSGSTNTTETFTGLTSGNYTVYIIDASGCTASQTIAVPAGEFRTGDFITTVPNSITAVENPIILSLGTNISSINPLQSINTIVVTGGTISGVTLTFNLTFPQIYDAVFISKAYPDRSNYFLESVLKDSIGTNQGTNSNTEICTSLAEALQKDSIISRLYYITNSGTTITMTSKEYGDMYDLNTVVSIVGTGITLTNTQSGVVAYDGQLAADYSLYVELFVNTDLQFGATPVLTEYERVAELELPFNNTNVHKFDLSTVLKNFVSSPKIDFTMTGFTTSPSMDTTYFCKYGEKYPLIPNTNTKKKRYKGTTGVLYTLNSALDYEDDNDMSTYLGTLVTGLTASTVYTGVTFMNEAPNPKYISRGSKEYLYYLLPTQYQNALSLKGDIYYYNGTSQTGITFIQITNLTGLTNFGGVTVLAAGYDELGLAAYEASGNTKIRRIDFAVWQALYPSGTTEIQLTETRSYLLEIDEQPQKYDVAFLNKLGTYETFSFVGEVVEDAEVIRQTYQTPYSVGTSGAAGKGFQYNGVYETSYTKLWTVNTGTIDEDTYYFVQQLVNSNRLYNYSNVHENFLTVVSQTVTKSSNSAEFTCQIQFKETIFENNVEK